MLDMYVENAHVFCNRDLQEEELNINVMYHYMLMSYMDIYGKTSTV